MSPSYLSSFALKQLLWNWEDLLLHLHPSPSYSLPLSDFNTEHLEPGASKIQSQKLSFLCGQSRQRPCSQCLLAKHSKTGGKKRCLFEPDPSGVDRTCVGSILTTAAALLSADRPFFISARKRLEMSLSCSSPRRIACRNLSTWNKGPSVWVFFLKKKALFSLIKGG